MCEGVIRKDFADEEATDDRNSQRQETVWSEGEEIQDGKAMLTLEEFLEEAKEEIMMAESIAKPLVAVPMQSSQSLEGHDLIRIAETSDANDLLLSVARRYMRAWHTVARQRWQTHGEEAEGEASPASCAVQTEATSASTPYEVPFEELRAGVLPIRSTASTPPRARSRRRAAASATPSRSTSSASPSVRLPRDGIGQGSDDHRRQLLDTRREQAPRDMKREFFLQSVSADVSTNVQRQLQTALRLNGGEANFRRAAGKYSKDKSKKITASQLRQLIRGKLKVHPAKVSNKDMDAVVRALAGPDPQTVMVDDFLQFVTVGARTFAPLYELDISLTGLEALPCQSTVIHGVDEVNLADLDSYSERVGCSISSGQLGVQRALGQFMSKGFSLLEGEAVDSALAPFEIHAQGRRQQIKVEMSIRRATAACEVSYRISCTTLDQPVKARAVSFAATEITDHSALRKEEVPFVKVRQRTANGKMYGLSFARELHSACRVADRPYTTFVTQPLSSKPLVWNAVENCSESELDGMQPMDVAIDVLPEQPAAPETYVTVTVVSAFALQCGNHRAPANVFVICSILGKPDVAYRTSVSCPSPNPEWCETFDLVPFAAGDSLEFQVVGYDGSDGRLLGEAILEAEDIHPDGFDGTVPLAKAQGHGATLALRVTVARERKGDIVAGLDASRPNTPNGSPLNAEIPSYEPEVGLILEQPVAEQRLTRDSRSVVERPRHDVVRDVAAVQTDSPFMVDVGVQNRIEQGGKGTENAVACLAYDSSAQPANVDSKAEGVHNVTGVEDVAALRTSMVDGSREDSALVRRMVMQMIRDLDKENRQTCALLISQGFDAHRMRFDAADQARSVDLLLQDFPEEWFSSMLELIKDLRMENVSLHALQMQPSLEAPDDGVDVLQRLRDEYAAKEHEDMIVDEIRGLLHHLQRETAKMDALHCH